MNRQQIKILALYLPLTAFIIVLDNAFPGSYAVSKFKFASISALFLMCRSLKKKYQEQVLLNTAVFFAVTGDFFLVFYPTLTRFNLNSTLLGALNFSIAYIIIIRAFKKNPKLRATELLAIIPVLVLVIPTLVMIAPELDPLLLLGTFGFSFAISYMAWTAVCSMLRGYFRPGISPVIALSGYLMLICDVAVANLMLNPLLAGNFWLKNLVWGAYLPAWALLGVIIAEDELVN